MTITVGIVLFCLGAIGTVANFWLSFLDYPLHRLLGGSPADYHRMSGLPFFASGFLWISMPFLSGQPAFMWAHSSFRYSTQAAFTGWSLMTYTGCGAETDRTSKSLELLSHLYARE